MSGDSKATLQGQSRKHGLPPGTIVYVGETPLQEPRIHLIRYNENTSSEADLGIAELQRLPRNDPGWIRWLNIDGLSRIELLEKTGDLFGIHLLTLEDIANTNQRPKFDTFDNYLFVTVKMLRFDDTEMKILTEHVGLVFTPDCVLSYQEAPGDVFDILRDRIRQGKGRVRGQGSDYLVFCLLDAIVDGYFYVLETLGDRIAELEEQVGEKTHLPEILNRIHELKQEIIYVRRCAWPLREVISSMQKVPETRFSPSVFVYLRDLYDHAVQVIDTLETYRDLLASLTDLHMSMISNRMNEVMKVLTIIATIFIPLTFIAGVYGMNFRFMPELDVWWSYPAVLLLMVGVAWGMLAFFRRKGWF
ncbi:MAG: magnesium/cobalt transporter CorA [Kiritimatiellia bacterium]|nr:magnesium/cobalt transporter CorA [Kiritimatiellia bacterium]